MSSVTDEGGSVWFAMELVGGGALYLSADSMSIKKGTEVNLAKRSNDPSQVWLFDGTTGKIQSRHSGLFMQVEQTSGPGSVVTLEEEAGLDAQQFTLEFYDEEGEDLDAMHIVAQNGFMLGAAAMPGAPAVTVPPHEDGEDSEEEAAKGDHVRRWRIIRLAEPGPAGPIPTKELKALGWDE